MFWLLAYCAILLGVLVLAQSIFWAGGLEDEWTENVARCECFFTESGAVAVMCNRCHRERLRKKTETIQKKFRPPNKVAPQ